MSLGNKPERGTLKPFPADRIVVPHWELDAATYDARIPVQNILWHAGRTEPVVRPPCDACKSKELHCNRDGRRCEGCAAEGVDCDWVSKQWEPLPGPGGEPPVKQKRPYTRKAKAGDETAAAPKKPGRKPPPPAATTTTGKRKRDADDEAPAKPTGSKRSRKQEEQKTHIAQLEKELAAIRAAAMIATPAWDTPVQLARKRVARRTGRTPPLWAESLQDLLDILPRYEGRTTDGIAKDWDALLLGVGGTAHPDDRWVQDGVLELSFVRTFTKSPERAPPDAPRQPPQADAPAIIQHPPSTEPVPTNIIHPPRLPTPPLASACPLLAPPDEITMLLRLFANRIPVLVLLSAASPLRPPCVIPDDGVLWLGYFGVESVEEDYPVPPVLGKQHWKGTKRWKFLLRWCFHESMDGEGAARPWFVPRPIATDASADVTPSQPARPQFAGYPQLAGVAPPGSSSPEDELQIDPALSGTGVSALQHGLEKLQVDVPPHRPPGSFVPANYPLVPLPSAVYVTERREGDPPRGWCCPCGRLNVRRWLSEWDCASCTRTRPIPALHSRAVRNRWDIRSPIIDLEVVSHARGTVPPLLEGWDDGSSLMRYPSALACHVVPAREREELDRVFEALQMAPGAFGRGVKVGNVVYFGGTPGREEREGVKVSRAPAKGAGKKPRNPPFGLVRDPLSTAHPAVPSLDDVREWMDLALVLAADTSEPHSDAELDADIPTTAGKTLFGLMCLDEAKVPFQIRLPVVDPTFNLVALALGANVTLSLPGRPRQAPKPRDTMTSMPNDFLVSLAHGDIFVLDELAAGELMEIRTEGAAMLLVCY